MNEAVGRTHHRLPTSGKLNQAKRCLTRWGYTPPPPTSSPPPPPPSQLFPFRPQNLSFSSPALLLLTTLAQPTPAPTNGRRRRQHRYQPDDAAAAAAAAANHHPSTRHPFIHSGCVRTLAQRLCFCLPDISYIKAATVMRPPILHIRSFLENITDLLRTALLSDAPTRYSFLFFSFSLSIQDDAG